MALSSMSGVHRTSQLRKASARHRLHSFLEQISTLETSNFPHPDGKDALKLLRKETERQLKRLSRGSLANDALVDSLYTQARLTVFKYTPILGFILRSTNVRNAFEVHFPLKRLVKTLIGSNAKLIVSSEWGFVPFTYPMTLDQLPEFALVGGPASESGNVLTIPVAGHEIGHSAWRAHSSSFGLEQRLLLEANRSLTHHPRAAANLIKELGGGSRATDQLLRSIFRNGLKQLEEIFCDGVGLYFFGASFLYAMEYFLAPGGGPRGLTYPSDLKRLDLLKGGCAALGIAPTQPIFERWSDSVLQGNQNKDFIVVLDHAVSSLAYDAMDAAFALLRAKGVKPPDGGRINSVVEAFERGEPDTGEASLPEIVTAGWEIVRKEDGLGERKHSKRYKELGDLMLKSIEVAEFRLRMASA